MVIKRSLSVTIAIALATSLIVGVPAAATQPTSQRDESLLRDTVKLSQDSAGVLEQFVNAREMGIPVEVLEMAEAVAVFPNVTRVQPLLFGQTKGRGLIARRVGGDGWSVPAIFEIDTTKAFSPRIGASRSEIVLLFMRRTAVMEAAGGKIELGEDLSVKAGPTGLRSSVRPYGLPDRDVYAYARNDYKFLFGPRFDGATVEPRDEENKRALGMTAAEALNKNLTGEKFGSYQMPVAALSNRLAALSNAVPYDPKEPISPYRPHIDDFVKNDAEEDEYHFRHDFPEYLTKAKAFLRDLNVNEACKRTRREGAPDPCSENALAIHERIKDNVTIYVTEWECFDKSVVQRCEKLNSSRDISRMKKASYMLRISKHPNPKLDCVSVTFSYLVVSRSTFALNDPTLRVLKDASPPHKLNIVAALESHLQGGKGNEECRSR